MQKKIQFPQYNCPYSADNSIYLFIYLVFF